MLDPITNRLIAQKATESEPRGEKLFYGKAQCSISHSGPAVLDHQLHDLHKPHAEAER